MALTPPTKTQPLTAAIAANTTQPPGSKASAKPKPADKAADKAPAADKPASADKTTAADRPAPAKPAASVAHGSSPYAVQVGASPSQDDAKGLMGRVQKKFSGEVSGFKTDVVAATVDGKTVYRALISGFAAAGDANRLCDQLKAGGQACFVRK